MKLSMIMAMRASPPPRRPNTRMQLDRFAREIVVFLRLPDAARLRRLMRRALGAQAMERGHQKQLD